MPLVNNAAIIIINSGTLNINTDITISSLIINPGAIINVKPGISVTIFLCSEQYP